MALYDTSNAVRSMRPIAPTSNPSYSGIQHIANGHQEMRDIDGYWYTTRASEQTGSITLSAHAKIAGFPHGHEQLLEAKIQGSEVAFSKLELNVQHSLEVSLIIRDRQLAVLAAITSPRGGAVSHCPQTTVRASLLSRSGTIESKGGILPRMISTQEITAESMALGAEYIDMQAETADTFGGFFQCLNYLGGLHLVCHGPVLSDSSADVRGLRILFQNFEGLNFDPAAPSFDPLAMVRIAGSLLVTASSSGSARDMRANKHPDMLSRAITHEGKPLFQL